VPTYDYTCTACPIHFSKRRRITERNDPIDCPSCGAPATKRLTGCAINTSGAGTKTSLRVPPGRPRPLGGTANLPIVGRDGKLYSADRKTLLQE